MSQDKTDVTPLEEEGAVPSADKGDELADLAGVSPEEAGPNEEARLREELEKTRAEIEELKDQQLRKAADMDNFRKRLLRDKEEAVLFANRGILTDLIQIVDDFERAIKSSESARDFDTLHNGIVMIEQQFVSMLERKYGLKRFESAGNEFDPTCHEAVMMENRDDHHVAMVLEDLQKGYMLHDKVLRTSKVKVSNPLGTAPTTETKE